MKTGSGRCSQAITKLKRLVLFVTLGSALIALQSSFTSGQTRRVLDLKPHTSQDKQKSWATIATVLEYAAGHRMKPCQLQSLSVLPYLGNTKRLGACCAVEADLNQMCENPVVNNYLEMSAFLNDKLGVRNEVVPGVATFNEIVKNIDNDRPVFIWLERISNRHPLNKVVVVVGYHSFEQRVSSTTPPPGSLVIFDPWRPALYEDGRMIEREQLISYPDVQSGYSWAGTILLIDGPSVKTPQWIKSNESKPYPDYAIQAGTVNDQPIYVCRTDGNLGKLINGKCHITYWATYPRRNQETSTSSYEVLIGDPVHTSWSARVDDYVNSVNVTDEPFPRPGGSFIALFLCRAIERGKVYLGMVYGSNCVISTEDTTRLNVKEFHTFDFKRPVTLEFPTAALEVELSQQLLNAENRFLESVKQLTKINGTLPGK